MTGPHDPAAAGGDRLRAGHADREQVIEALKNAFVHGRLTKDELDTRAAQALAARTYADLAALTADIRPPRPQPHRRAPAVPAQRRPLARAAAGSAAAWSSPSPPCRSTASPIRATPPAPSPGPWRSRASWWPLPPYSRHCWS